MYRKILVPLDGSELAECVLAHVESITKDCKTTDVVFVQVVEEATLPEGDWFEGGVTMGKVSNIKTAQQINTINRSKAREYLEGVAQRIKLSGVKAKTEVLMGKPAEAIADYAAGNQADLIVIATHGRSGPSRWLWGSVADRILRSSCVPVLMVRAPGCYGGI